jgi:hypothetical protein
LVDSWRNHNPASDVSNLPTASNQRIADFPSAANCASLSTVSILLPNPLEELHTGIIPQDDSWRSMKVDSYIQWARTLNSLRILTFDENDARAGTRS